VAQKIKKPGANIDTNEQIVVLYNSTITINVVSLLPDKLK